MIRCPSSYAPEIGGVRSSVGIRTIRTDTAQRKSRKGSGRRCTVRYRALEVGPNRMCGRLATRSRSGPWTRSLANVVSQERECCTKRLWKHVPLKVESCTTRVPFFIGWGRAWMGGGRSGKPDLDQSSSPRTTTWHLPELKLLGLSAAAATTRGPIADGRCRLEFLLDAVDRSLSRRSSRTALKIQIRYLWRC